MNVLGVCDTWTGYNIYFPNSVADQSTSLCWAVHWWTLCIHSEHAQWHSGPKGAGQNSPEQRG